MSASPNVHYLSSPSISNRATSPARSLSARRPRSAAQSPTRPQIAYTLTACTRCRERKSRCDAALPRCRPCERSGSHCEYWDGAKGCKLPRNYIVDLQNQVRALEEDLSRFKIDYELEPDQEDMIKEAAVVEFRETAEKKFLGPSSGTSMTRLVMRFAKQVVGARSIREVIPSDRFRNAEHSNKSEMGKATSKIDPESYPLVSSYAAKELPGKDLVLLLLKLYNVKVQSMYPVFHEPSLQTIFEDIYAGSPDPFNNFIVRMVIAIGLQRLDTKYAGTGDSYYLSALAYFEPVVRAMNLQTLQCFALISEYCLLTPTRTAAFYIVGMGVRIAQAIGICDEATIAINDDGSPATPYDIDMKRRIFWALVTMDYGLSHSLGRPAMLATAQTNVNVGWFAAVEDDFITPREILPGPFSIRKWIAIHFYKMRLLQLEIRRNLYLQKRPTPEDENDPWFKQMEDKLQSWRDASPNDDQGSGFSRKWFTGRYNTMIVMMFRPTPQVPNPSARAALLCYEASEYNIHMQREQIAQRTVEVTWIFTQTIFMCVNAILWALSYAEVRQHRSREEVGKHLTVAVEAMKLASERWPGVTSAISMYERLIAACLKAYEIDGDINIHSSPFNSSDQQSNSGDSSVRSRTQSPSLSTQSPALSHRSHNDLAPTSGAPSPFSRPHASSGSNADLNGGQSPQSTNSQLLAAPMMNGNHLSSSGLPTTQVRQSQYHGLPTTHAEMNNWHFQPMAHEAVADPAGQNGLHQYPTDLWFEYEENDAWVEAHDGNEGLSQEQGLQLMQNLEQSGMGNIESMITEATSSWQELPREPGPASNIWSSPST